MPLDPQFRAVLDTFEAKGLIPLVRGDAAQTRAHYRTLALSRRGPQYVPEPVASATDQHSPGGVPVRIYEPLQANGGTLIYLHGGGWVVGDVETHDPLCRRVANATGARVVSVDYRLAPEHPYPAGLDDAEEVLHWLWTEDPGRPLGAAGDSAGASLAAGLALRARDKQIPLAAHLMLYPATAPAMTSPSFAENGEGYFLTAATWPGSTSSTSPPDRPAPRRPTWPAPMWPVWPRPSWPPRSSIRCATRAPPTPPAWPTPGCPPSTSPARGLSTASPPSSVSSTPPTPPWLPSWTAWPRPCKRGRPGPGSVGPIDRVDHGPFGKNLCRTGRGVTVPVRVMPRVVAGLPVFSQARRVQVPVRADLPGRLAQVTPQVLERRPAPEPVAVVDAVDDQARPEHQGVRDHRVVVRVGVLLDVQVLLDVPAGVGQERPLGADRAPELVGLQDVVGRDRDDLGVRDGDLRVVGGQLQVLLVVFGAEVAAGQEQDHRVDALQLAQLAPRLGVVGELVVREHPARHDV